MQLLNFDQLSLVWYSHGVCNTVKENSSVFSLVQMHELPSATARGQ